MCRTGPSASRLSEQRSPSRKVLWIALLLVRYRSRGRSGSTEEGLNNARLDTAGRALLVPNDAVRAAEECSVFVRIESLAQPELFTVGRGRLAEDDERAPQTAPAYSVITLHCGCQYLFWSFSCAPSMGPVAEHDRRECSEALMGAGRCVALPQSLRPAELSAGLANSSERILTWLFADELSSSPRLSRRRSSPFSSSTSTHAARSISISKSSKSTAVHSFLLPFETLLTRPAPSPPPSRHQRHNSRPHLRRPPPLRLRLRPLPRLLPLHLSYRPTPNRPLRTIDPSSPSFERRGWNNWEWEHDHIGLVSGGGERVAVLDGRGAAEEWESHARQS